MIPRLTSDPANEDFFRCFSDLANECFSGCAREHKAANMNGRAIPRAYLFRLYVCVRQRNELTTADRGDPPTRLGCLPSRQREVRRLIT